MRPPDSNRAADALDEWFALPGGREISCFDVVPLPEPDDSAAELASPQTSDEASRAERLEVDLAEAMSSLVTCRYSINVLSTERQRLQNRVRRLRQMVARQRRAIDAARREEADTLMSRVEDAERRASEAERRTVEALTRAVDMRAESEIAKARTVEAVLRLADRCLATIGIHDSVVERAVVLDRSGSRRSRARAVGSVIAALHAYATDSTRGGDFKEWCAAGGRDGVSYSANRVAMHESVSVQRDQQQSAARVFPVDVLLDDSERMQMLAHIKLDQGPTAPRLYFHDDTRGRTGKIHIGYVGPHLPTANDPT